ncbi:MAG: glycosyltransferase family 39 protein [Bacteroidota bacterium]
MPYSPAAPTRPVSFWIWALILLALIAPPHLAGIDRFATIDEPWWVISGSNFYYALTHRDFAHTIYDYHPAVTTTWVVTAGMLTVFPEYRGFGQGYFDVRKPNFDNFLMEHGQRTLDLLRNSRLIQSLLLIGLAVLLFYLLQRLMPRAAALAAVGMGFNAPFFLGHSRLLNHEGMLTMFIMVSVAAMYAYLHAGRRWVLLLVSGAAFGLAQLTKSSSIVVTGVIGLMLLVDLLRQGERPRRLRLLGAIKLFAIWAGSAALIYFVLWPGMWVAPGKMLYEVYGNAFSYAFQGARLDVTQELEPAAFSLSGGWGGVMLYLSRWVLRSTPLAWIGLVLTMVFLLCRRLDVPARGLIAYLLLIAILFVLMFGLARGRDSTHYILVSFFSLDMVAGWAWACGLTWLVERWRIAARTAVVGALAALVVVGQTASGLPFRPYYYTYANPIAVWRRANPPAGYGEGLEQAAAYLARKQDSQGLRVFAYDGMGPFSYFFPGRTEVMKKAYFWEPGLPDVIRGMRWSEYIVVYSAVQESLPECAGFLAALKDVKPEKVIVLDGMEAVRVYRSQDIPESVYQKLAE